MSRTQNLSWSNSVRYREEKQSAKYTIKESYQSESTGGDGAHLSEMFLVLVLLLFILVLLVVVGGRLGHDNRLGVPGGVGVTATGVGSLRVHRLLGGLLLLLVVVEEVVVMLLLGHPRFDNASRRSGNGRCGTRHAWLRYL